MHSHVEEDSKPEKGRNPLGALIEHHKEAHLYQQLIEATSGVSDQNLSAFGLIIFRFEYKEC